MRKIYLSPQLAILIILLFGGGATYLIVHAISQVQFQYLAEEGNAGM